MKSILKITLLTVLSYSALLSAQDTEKWYADDIYFDQNEKEISYVSIVQYNDVYMEEDSLEDYSEGRMSYSMRINRFHRDYYGSSINFNYGYFHDPYGYEFGFGCSPFFAPYSFNSFYGGYYGLNSWYNPWASPWNNYYAWNNPFGFNYGYGYGFGYTPYFFGNVIYTSSETTYYGPRNGTSSNIPNETGIRPARNNDSQGLQNTIMQNPIVRSIVKGSRESISRQGYYSPNKPRTEYTKPNRSSSPSQKQNSYLKPARNNNSNSYNKPSNTRSNTNYSPARSGSSRPSSSPSRKPR